jgi:tetratricopeptide (TPR) repeat protein
MVDSWRGRFTLGIVALVAAGALAGALALRHAKQGMSAAPGTPPSGDSRPGSGGAGVPAGDAFTIVVLGGSTALGEPYAPRADFGRISALLLGGRLGGRPIAVSNRAVKGRATSAVMRDAHDLVAEHPRPDRTAVFLYVGNNEFLGFDRRHDLRRSERNRFDVPVVSASERNAVLERQRRSLESILTSLRESGIFVVAAVPVVNLKDWDPNRSCLTDPAHAAAMERLLDAGERDAAAGDVQAALQCFQAALALEPDFAAAAKRSGDCLLQLGRSDEARRAFQHAVDCDGNPYREISLQVGLLRQVCAARQVPVVDAQALLEAGSPNGIVGNELLWDNCHPTLEGYLRIARGMAAALLAGLGVSAPLAALTTADVERACGIDGRFMQQVYNGRGQYCYAAATLSWDPRPRLVRARTYLEEAARHGPEDADVTCSLAVLSALEGTVDRSLEMWRRAVQLDPQVARRRMANPYVVQIMKRHGVADLAERVGSSP